MYTYPTTTSTERNIDMRLLLVSNVDDVVEHLPCYEGVLVCSGADELFKSAMTRVFNMSDDNVLCWSSEYKELGENSTTYRGLDGFEELYGIVKSEVDKRRNCESENKPLTVILYGIDDHMCSTNMGRISEMLNDYSSVYVYCYVVSKASGSVEKEITRTMSKGMVINVNELNDTGRHSIDSHTPSTGEKPTTFGDVVGNELLSAIDKLMSIGEHESPTPTADGEIQVNSVEQKCYRLTGSYTGEGEFIERLYSEDGTLLYEVKEHIGDEAKDTVVEFFYIEGTKNQCVAIEMSTDVPSLFAARAVYLKVLDGTAKVVYDTGYVDAETSLELYFDEDADDFELEPTRPQLR